MGREKDQGEKKKFLGDLMDFIISSPHGHSLPKLPDSISGNIAPIEKPEKTEAIKNMISSSSEEDSKGSKLNGVSFEKSPHKENSSLKDMSESELKEADLDLLDSSVSQVDSSVSQVDSSVSQVDSNSLKVPFEFSEVNLENSSKRENSSFKHSSGSCKLLRHNFYSVQGPPSKRDLFLKSK